MFKLMKINPFQINFKSNVEVAKPLQDNALSTNPIKAQVTELPNITPSFNVKLPTKYTSLGTIKLPCSTTASMYKLANGQRVVIIPKEGSTIVKTYVNVGSMNEPEKVRGISHFVEHSLFNGSNGLESGEFFDTVNKMGANTNASTGFAATDYYVSSHLLKKNDLEKEIKIHSSMIESPKFALDMIEKEKGPVASEINMILDNPNNLATNNTIKMLYNIQSSSTDLIGGTVDNISKLTREDVVDYYQRNYTPQNMVTVITGEVDPDETIALVSKYFSAKNNANPQPRYYEKLTPIEKSVRSDIISDKATSTIISMGFNGAKNNSSKDKMHVDALQALLTGSSVARLSKSLEKHQASSYISSDRISTRPEDSLVSLVDAETSEENCEGVIKTIFNEISNIEKIPPTVEEMDMIKKKLKVQMSGAFESSSVINYNVGKALLDNDIANITEYDKFVDGLTSKDIVDFAKKCFDLNKVAITVVHPSTASAESINNNYNKQNTNAISFTGKVDEINHKVVINTSSVKQYVLPNNLSVATNNTKSDMAVFDFDLSTAAPADVKPGVSSLLSIMMTRGSVFNDKDKFYTEQEKQGISAGFAASSSGIAASSSFLASDSVIAIKRSKEVLLNPRLTQETLDYAKDIIKEDIKTASKNSGEGLMKEMFKGQPYGTTVEDIAKNIDDIQLADVKGLYQYIMDNAQGTAVISAPFENSEQNSNLKQDVINELCSDLPVFKKSKPELFNSFIPIQSKNIVVQEHAKSQAEIQMGYKFKSNDNLKDFVSFEILNTILGGTASSRLFSDLREQQKLAYRVNSSVGFHDNSGVMSLYIKTTTDNTETGEVSYDNLQKSLKGFNSHIQKLMNENVSENELESAKLNMKTELLDSSESTMGKNTSILSGLTSPYGVSKDNQALALIDKITVEDIKACANYIFNSNPTISIVATKNTIEHNNDYLKFLGNVIS